MTVKFNNTEIQDVKYNGVDVETLQYNGITVWERSYRIDEIVHENQYFEDNPNETWSKVENIQIKANGMYEITCIAAGGYSTYETIFRNFPAQSSIDMYLKVAGGGAGEVKTQTLFLSKGEYIITASNQFTNIKFNDQLILQSYAGGKARLSREYYHTTSQDTPGRYANGYSTLSGGDGEMKVVSKTSEWYYNTSTITTSALGGNNNTIYGSGGSRNMIVGHDVSSPTIITNDIVQPGPSYIKIVYKGN